MCCAFVSCNNKKSPSLNKSTWIEYKLDDYWVFNAPKGTKIIYLKGIDSTPGNIVLTMNDSVNLQFDSGLEMTLSDTVCNLGSDAVRAKFKIAQGLYKSDTIHQAKIDTVNGKIATIITPVNTGRGWTEIHISDCESDRWLGIYGKDIPSDKQELVLKIYNSIQHKASE